MADMVELMVEFPSKAPVAIEGLGKTEEPRRRRHDGREDGLAATYLVAVHIVAIVAFWS